MLFIIIGCRIFATGADRNCEALLGRTQTVRLVLDTFTFGLGGVFRKRTLNDVMREL